MNKYKIYLNLILIFLSTSLLVSCTKSKVALQSSAQNIYPYNFDNSSESNDWYLTDNELGFLSNEYGSLTPNLFKPVEKTFRVGFSFKNNHFFNNLADTFSHFWQGNAWWNFTNSRLIQLDETHFLQENTYRIEKNSSSSDEYHQLYLTDNHLKNKILITGRDSTYSVLNAQFLPDKRIILYETQSWTIGSRSKLSCLNLDNKFDWVKSINTINPRGEVYYRDGFAITNNTIYVLSVEFGAQHYSNGIKSFDFSGNLINALIFPFQEKLSFSHLSAHNNSVLLTGTKFNETTLRDDFCFLTMDNSLNRLSEKTIPFDAVMADSDPFKQNEYQYPKPIFFENSLWVMISYLTNRSGSNVKLVKLNQSFDVELVKTIINNIQQDLSILEIKSNQEYIYLGGIINQGCFFYRLDKMGNFK